MTVVTTKGMPRLHDMRSLPVLALFEFWACQSIHPGFVHISLGTETRTDERILLARLTATNHSLRPLVLEVRSAVTVPRSVAVEPFTVVIPGTDGREPGPVTVAAPLRFRSRGTAEDLALLDNLERALDRGTLTIHVTGRAYLGLHARDFDERIPITRSAP